MPLDGKDAMPQAGVLPTRIKASGDRATDVFNFDMEQQPIQRERLIANNNNEVRKMTKVGEEAEV